MAFINRNPGKDPPSGGDSFSLSSKSPRQDSYLEAIFDANPSGIAVLVKPDLRFAYVNPAYRYATPDPSLDPLGKPFAQVWPKKSKYGLRDRLRTVLENGQPFILQGMEHTFLDGSQRVFTVQARRMDWEGEPAVLLLVWDVSEQTRAYRALEQEQARLSAVLETLPVGVVILDQLGGIVHANPMYEQVWGGKPPSTHSIAEYTPYQAWWVADDRPVQNEEWASARAIRDGKAVFGQEMRIQRFDGRQAYVLNSAAPIKDSAGQVIGCVVAILDISEQKQSQATLSQALQQSEASQRTLQALMDYIPEGITIAQAPDAVIQMVSRYGQEILGGPHERKTAERVASEWTVYEPDGITPMAKERLPLIRAIQKGEVVENQDLVQVNAQGMALQLLCNAGPIRDVDGRITGGVVAWRDIGERKKSEQALQSYQQLLEAVIQNMPSAVNLMRGSDLRIEFFNPAYQAIAPGKVIVGKTLNELWPETQRDFAELCRKVLETGEPYLMVDEAFQISRSPGGPLERAYFTWSLYRVDLPGEKDGGILNVAWETTERVLTEHALRDSEVMYRLALAAGQAGAWSWNLETNAMQCSDAFFRILGYAPGAFQPTFDFGISLVHPDDRDWVKEKILTARADGSNLDLVFRTVWPDGSVHWIRMISQTFMEKGQPSRMAGFIVDITDMKEAEEETHARVVQTEIHRRLLDQREQERLRIARDLHDGPTQELIAATYSVQELIQSTQDPALKEGLENINQKLYQQISELRAYSGELRPPALEQFGLMKAIQSHAEAYQQTHPNISIHIIENRQGDLVPHEIRLALFRIYQEALTNIAKHSQASQVEVRLEKDDDRIVLEISDNGSGFVLPQDWLELARQGHLGLVGMQERAEAIGGKLSLDSNLNGGTRIKVAIPLSEKRDDINQ